MKLGEFLRPFICRVLIICFCINGMVCLPAIGQEILPEDTLVNDQNIDSSNFLMLDPLLNEQINEEANSQREEKISSLASEASEASEVSEGSEKSLDTPQKRKAKFKDHTVLFYVYCLILVLYAIVRWKYEEFLGLLNRVVSNRRMAQIYFEDSQSQFLIPLVLMFFNTILISGVLFYYFLLNLGVFDAFPFWKLLAYSVSVSLLFFSFKFLMQKFLVWLTPMGKELDFYLYLRIRILLVLGIVLVIPSLLLSYSSLIPNAIVLTLIGLAVIITSAIIFYYGIIINLRTLRIHPFHFFLYLCALELAPFLILYKVHSNLMFL